MINYYYMREYISAYNLIYNYLNSFSSLEDHYSALLLVFDTGEIDNEDREDKEYCLAENKVSEFITISKWEI